MPNPAAVRSKAWVCGCTFAEIVGSNPSEDMDGSLLSVVCCQVEVSAKGRLLVRRSLTECGVSECVREISVRKRPWLTRGCCAVEWKEILKN
jgi:hypothetical protein